MKIFLVCDGASIGNGLSAGAGVVIKDEAGKTIESLSHHIGAGSNNVAEYTAVIIGLKRAVELKATEVIVLSDSNLVINQLKGEWQIKAKDLNQYIDEVKGLAKSIKKVTYDYVPREYTHEADALARSASEQGVEKETESKYPFLNKI